MKAIDYLSFFFKKMKKECGLKGDAAEEAQKEAGPVSQQSLPEYLNNQLRDWIPFLSVILKKTVI